MIPGAKRTARPRVVAALLAAIGIQAVAGCIIIPVDLGTGPGSPETFPLPPAQIRPAEIDAQEAEAHRLVNQHRASRGLSPLAHDLRVAEIARAHSRAMAYGSTAFGHDGFSARSAEIQRLHSVRSVAENIAYDSRDPAAAAIVPGWIDSPGHRANIEGGFDLTGIGAARSSDGTSYFTQIFLARR